MGLKAYYDSRKSYNTSSYIWPDLSTVNDGPDMTTTSDITFLTSSKDLRLYADTYSSASFVNMPMSESFAIEMFIMPSASVVATTLLSTETGTYPYIWTYITGSELKTDYVSGSGEPTISVSGSITPFKYNHVVLFVSSSDMSLWINGSFQSTASIETISTWNGAIVGDNNTYPQLYSYDGYMSVIKIWNSVEINRITTNQFYSGKDFWSALPIIDILP